MSKLRVVPSILTDDPDELRRMLEQAATFTDFVQIDFMDGDFVPSRSIEVVDVARLSPSIRWEAHLMVTRPEDWLAAVAEAGASRVVLHLETSADCNDQAARASSLGLWAGLALNPASSLNDACDCVGPGLFDSLLFLSVEPGYYGRPFLPSVLDKVAEAKRRLPATILGIDGGIKQANLAEVAKSGVNVAYVGSAIFLAPDPAAAFRELQNIAGEA